MVDKKTRSEKKKKKRKRKEEKKKKKKERREKMEKCGKNKCRTTTMVEKKKGKWLLVWLRWSV